MFLLGFVPTVLLISVSALRANENPLPAVQPGQWQWLELGGPDRSRVCATDLTRLMIPHTTPGACRLVRIETGRRTQVIEYSCAGVGRGRSVATIVDPQTVRLQTQGVRDGAPFAADYDVRRVGGCDRARITTARVNL